MTQPTEHQLDYGKFALISLAPIPGTFDIEFYRDMFSTPLPNRLGKREHVYHVDGGVSYLPASWINRSFGNVYKYGEEVLFSYINISPDALLRALIEIGDVIQFEANTFGINAQTQLRIIEELSEKGVLED